MTNIAANAAVQYVNNDQANQAQSLADLTFYFDLHNMIADTKGLTVSAVSRCLIADHNYPETVKGSLASRMSEVKSIVKTANTLGVTFWSLVDDYNDQRADDNKAPVYSVQGLAKVLGTRKTAKPVDNSVTESDESVKGDDSLPSETATTPLIDVMLSNVNNLTADELTILAMAIGQRQDSLANVKVAA